METLFNIFLSFFYDQQVDLLLIIRGKENDGSSWMLTFSQDEFDNVETGM